MSSVSSRRASLVDSPSHVTCSSVIAAPAAAVVRALRNIDAIKRYGVDGRIVGCSVMENSIPPNEVGAVRRCTLLFAPYRDTLLREKLVRVTEDVHAAEEEELRADVVDGADGGEAAAKVTEVVLEYVPCSAGEQHRSPFTPDVEAVLRSASTTFRVSGVSRNVNRCYLEAIGCFSLGVHYGARVPLEDRLRDKQHRRAVHEFWTAYLNAQLQALEGQIVKEVHQRLDDRIPAELGAAFRAHEDVLCAWAAEATDVLPRDAVAAELEQVLVWWSRTLSECQHQRLLAEAAAAAPGPRATARATKGGTPGGAWPQQSHDLTPPSPGRETRVETASSGSFSTGSTQRIGVPFGTPNSSHDESQPRYRPQFGLVSAAPPSPPPASVRGLSPTPATSTPQSAGAPDSRRASVPSPRDRRHTAAPFRSNLSSEPASEVLPPIAAASGNLPTPVSLVSLSAAAAGLPSSVAVNAAAPFSSPVQRRRSLATLHTSHLLSRANSNASRHGSFQSRSGPPRTSQLMQGAPAAAATAAPAHERAGLFFSQLLHSSSGSTAGGPAAVAPSTAAAAAAPSTVEDFHPGLVKHLFSLTGVLQEDVARRLFFSLCDDPNSASPCLSSAAMRRILQCVDPCGLREGKAHRSGQTSMSVEDEEEAYRAEVRRCYHEQQHQAFSPVRRAHDGKPEGRGSLLTISTIPGLLRSRGASSAMGASATPSTLSHLASRQEASRHAHEEAALDKMVQSTMARFAFHEKSALSYDEFCLAVLHLWKN